MELPDSDLACFHEAMLLACALIGSHPDQANVRVQLAALKQARGLGDVSLHVVHRDHGRLLFEDWIEVREDGSGRRHREPPPDSAGWPLIELDDADTPARDRL